MTDAKRARSWSSVCRDCVHLRSTRCEATKAQATPEDSFAAICEWFESQVYGEEQKGILIADKTRDGNSFKEDCS